MLHGVTLTDAKPVKAAKLFESGEFQSFHLSSACLDTTLGDKQKVKLVAKLDNQKEITLAILSRDQEMARLDLYLNVTQSIQLLLKGAPKGTEVSLSGFYEPPSDDMDEDMFMGGAGAEDEDDYGDEESEDEEDEKPVAKAKEGGKKEAAKLNQSLKQAQVNTAKNAVPSVPDDSDEDESDIIEDEEGEDLADLDEESEDESDEPVGKKKVVDDSDESEDESDEPVQKGASKKQAKQESDSDSDEDDKLASDSDSDEDEELALADIMKKKFEAGKKSKPTPEAPKKQE